MNVYIVWVGWESECEIDFLTSNSEKAYKREADLKKQQEEGEVSYDYIYVEVREVVE